jgi:hypothetical protein
VSTRRRPLRAALLMLAIATGAGRAHAWVPEPERAWSAVAQNNTSAARTRSLSLDVALVGSDGAVVATGTARLAPGGNERLGLTFTDGAVEVHERTATTYGATRGAAQVKNPVRLLPPLAVLQAASGLAVADALRAFGSDPALVDLGMEGSHDCWVIGGRDSGAFDANQRASLWVDQESQLPVRLDDGAGTQYRFGAPVAHEGIRFPASIEVLAAGFPGWRIDVKGVAPAP